MLVENTDPSPDIIRHALRASCLFVQQNDRYTTDDDLSKRAVTRYALLEEAEKGVDMSLTVPKAKEEMHECNQYGSGPRGLGGRL